jgi:hypothetical protein
MADILVFIFMVGQKQMATLVYLWLVARVGSITHLCRCKLNSLNSDFTPFHSSMRPC